MKKWFIVFSCAFLISCSHEVVNEYLDVNALRVSLIYNVDSVYAYKQKYKEANKSIANYYVEKAKKEAGVNPEKAIYFYKRAITLNPELETYKELAKLLEQLNRNEELHSLYNFFTSTVQIKQVDNTILYEYVFGKPDEDLYYEYVVSVVRLYHCLPNEELFTGEDGEHNLTKLQKRLMVETRLNMDTNSVQFKTIMLQFLPYDKIESAAKDPAMFRGFLSSIKDTSLEFNINEENVHKFNYEKFNGMDEDFMQITFEGVYIYYLKEKQDNKNNWIKFNMNHRMNLSKGFNTLIYAIDTSETACPREMRHVYHRIATYDNTGTIIDSKIIASQAGEELNTCMVRDKKIAVVHYKRKWKFPYKKTDFENELVNTTKVGESFYEINPEGKIIESPTTNPNGDESSF